MPLLFSQHAKLRPALFLAAHLALPLCVLAYSAYCALAQRPQWSAALLPSPLARLVSSAHWRQLAPHVASSLTRAWAHGEAEGVLALALEQGLGPLANASARAASALGVEPGTAEAADAPALLAALRAARAATAAWEAAQGTSLLSRAFTLLNLAFLVGVLGVLASLGPVLARFVAGLAHLALLVWQRFLAYVWQTCALLAAALVLHSAGDAALALDARVYLVLLAAGVCWGATACVLLEAERALELDGAEAARGLLGATLPLAVGPLLLAPLAHACGSALLGFLAVGALFALLGFGVRSFGAGLAIGYSGLDALRRCFAVGALLLALQALLQGGALGPAAAAAAAPFHAGMQVFGATQMYLAQLILCSPFSGGALAPSLLGLPMVGLLALGLVVGTLVPNMAALANTACVFFFLHALDVLTFASSRLGFWLAVLVVSLGLCGSALYAHSHPQLLASLA